jgi:hypothetical protein
MNKEIKVEGNEGSVGRRKENNEKYEKENERVMKPT